MADGSRRVSAWPVGISSLSDRNLSPSCLYCQWQGESRADKEGVIDGWNDSYKLTEVGTCHLHIQITRKHVYILSANMCVGLLT